MKTIVIVGLCFTLLQLGKAEPTGFPSQSVPADPMLVANTTFDLAFGYETFYNMTVHGLSDFTVEAVNSFFDETVIYVMIRGKQIILEGNLKMASPPTMEGPFNMTFTGVTAVGIAHLKTNSSGKLEIDKWLTDIEYKTLQVWTDKPAFSYYWSFRTALNLHGMEVFLHLKPHILKEVDKQLKEEVNKQLSEISPKIRIASDGYKTPPLMILKILIVGLVILQ